MRATKHILFAIALIGIVGAFLPLIQIRSHGIPLDVTPKELSFGTIGPSLFQYDKLRGNTPDIQKYTYSKIWNAKGFNLCSEMPRFGHVGALNEQQVRHLVALLLDPASPVNK